MSKRGIFILIAVLVVVFGSGVLAWKFRAAREAPPVATVAPAEPVRETIGESVERRAIEAYSFGAGGTHLLFVGGIHGGYEWNSVVLAYRFIDYLRENPEAIPDALTISVIPSANPDGVFRAVGKEGRFAEADVSKDERVLAAARFNAHMVDLNRNFDCKWQPTSTWRNNPVSAGASAFSEPEARAVRDFILKTKPVAGIFWHSQSNAVYASECERGILSETLAIMNAYSGASGYRAVDSFDAYPITGDAEGWLASIGIPAITVELSTHQAIEWERNLAGIRAMLEYYGKHEP